MVEKREQDSQAQAGDDALFIRTIRRMLNTPPAPAGKKEAEPKPRPSRTPIGRRVGVTGSAAGDNTK